MQFLYLKWNPMVFLNFQITFHIKIGYFHTSSNCFNQSILLFLFYRCVFGYIWLVSASFSQLSPLRIVFFLFFRWFLVFLDILAFYPAVLTNLDFCADDVPEYLDFSAPFHLFLSISSWWNQWGNIKKICCIRMLYKSYK